MIGQSQRTAMLVLGAALVVGLAGGVVVDRYVLLPKGAEAGRDQQRNDGGREPRGNRPNGDDMRKRFSERMAKDLGLSDTQRAHLDSIYAHQFFVMDSLSKVSRPVYDSVWKASRMAVDSMLDSTQRAKLAEMRKQRRGRPGGGPDGRGGSGGPDGRDGRDGRGGPGGSGR